jgi:thiol-disulfide isomerase/thioredoxin
MNLAVGSALAVLAGAVVSVTATHTDAERCPASKSCFTAQPALSPGGEQGATAQQPSVDMEKFARFKLIDAKTTKTVTLASLKGKAKAIYLDFFASWCGPCQRIIPEVIELDKKTSDSDVLVLGINVSDEWDAMQGNIESQKITYRVLHDPTPRGQAGIGSIAGVNAIPTVMILDGKTLQIKQRWVGANPQFKAQQIELLKSLGVTVK